MAIILVCLQHIYWLLMGSIQSKIKEGYSVKEKPSLKKKSQKGVKPSANYYQNSSFKHEADEQSPQSELNALSETQSTHSSTRGSGKNIRSNAFSYPLTALGVIECKVDGVINYGIGALIEDNVVLTAAQNLASFGEKVDNLQVKFIVNDGSQSRPLRVDKIYMPENWQHKVSNPREYPETVFCNNYAILMLKDQADTQRYGKLGYDFHASHEQIHTEVTLYRLSHHAIKPYKFMAKVKGNTIKFNPSPYFQSHGGPIIIFRDNSPIVIGIQSCIQQEKGNKSERCLRLNEEIYSQVCEWCTQQQQQIDVRDKNLGKEGIKKLIKLDWATLSTINISKNNITSEGLKYFLKCEWKNLTHLDIGGNHIKKEGVAYLVKIPMRRLSTLNMWGNAIGSEGASLMAEAEWKYLNNINLYDNNICNMGLKKLLSVHWDYLQNMNLGKNSINMEVLPFFKGCAWRDIVTLNLWGNGIKNEKGVVVQLNKCFGRIKFLYL